MIDRLLEKCIPFFLPILWLAMICRSILTHPSGIAIGFRAIDTSLLVWQPILLLGALLLSIGTCWGGLPGVLFGLCLINESFHDPLAAGFLRIFGVIWIVFSALCAKKAFQDKKKR